MKIAMLLDGTVSADIRVAAYAPYLEKIGHVTTVHETGQLIEEKRLPIVDLAIFSRPNVYPFIEEYKKRGIRTIADVDDDFWSIPKSHVGYNHVGPGNPRFLEEMERSLKSVDEITVSTEVLADRMARFGHPISVIHNGWDNNNSYWYVPKTSLGKRIIIGWAGTITHREDFQQVVGSLVAITKRHPDVGILIGSDMHIYDMLHKIPESSKWFMPMLPYSMYPSLFRYIDIWIAPLVSNKFNEAKSDIKLVEGSVRKIPCVVSPVPAYSKWDGPLFAREESEWTTQLEKLIESPGLCKSIGEKQHRLAAERTIDHIAKEWIKLVG